LAAAPTPQNFNQGLHFGEPLDDTTRSINDLGPAWIAEPSVYDNIEGCDRLTANPKTPSQVGEKFYGPSALDRLSGEGLLKRATQRLCVNRGALDDVASMAVAALEHPEASVTATGEVGF
jgi:hypothetical protein